jgi:N-acetylglucosaminyldiphosphoundecaprenol N-acetyl-beta-D-mannosaminyltransferase
MRGDSENTQNSVRVLGVDIANLSTREAIRSIEALLLLKSDDPGKVFIVNAHSLNLAYEDPDYRSVLNSADIVLGDGTGIRMAAKRRGVHMKANLVGTDLVPALFDATAGKGYRYFLLGADERTNELAAHYAHSTFRGWTLAGSHHGYIDGDKEQETIAKINASRSHLLLVGMGNPKQESWIARNVGSLRVPVAIGVGGLFDHWGGNLNRAPRWVRKLGIEWLQILGQQPGRKWRRYLLGNPAYLWRASLATRNDLARSDQNASS